MIQQEICDDCQRLTAGSCWRHSNTIIDNGSINIQVGTCLLGHDYDYLRSEENADIFYCRRCLEYRGKYTNMIKYY